MAKLTDDELKNIKPTDGFYSWDSPRLPFAQLDKLFNDVKVAEIDNYPGHKDNAEGKKILRVDEADICKLVDEAQAAGKGFLREGVTITDGNRDLIVQTALGNLALGWDRPGGEGKPRRYYISEEKLIARLDQVDPAVVKKHEGYGEPSLAAHQLQAIIAEAELANVPQLNGKAYRITEQQLSLHNGSARNQDEWGFGFRLGGSSHVQTPEAKLGKLLGGIDGEDGKQRYYVTEAAYKKYIGGKPLTHDEIWALKKARDTGVSGGSAKPGYKEFTDSKLTSLVGADWRTRLQYYWEEAAGTGHEDVAAVDMQGLERRMQGEKDEARLRRETGGGGGFGGGRYGRGGFGGGGYGGRGW